MTDSARDRDNSGRRGLVELRLDELLPDRPVRGYFSALGAGSRDRGFDDGPGPGEPDVGEAHWGERDVREAEWEELDPVEVESDYRRGDSPDLPIEDRTGGAGRGRGPDGARAADGPSAAHGPRAAGGAGGAGGAGRVARLATLAQVGRWRVDPERRGALAVMAAILVAAVAVGWQALASRPQAQPVVDSTGSSSGASSLVTGSGSAAASSAITGSPALPSATATRVIVDVVGRVHRPGLVTLSAGARVADAVRAAGGALRGTSLTSINLARVCVDGEQIAVGVPGAAAPPGTATAGAAPGPGAPAALVNLNTATADQLDALPGVGPVMAQRIIAYRTDHGPFTAVSQLQQVSGIGTAKYADLSPLVTV